MHAATETVPFVPAQKPYHEVRLRKPSGMLFKTLFPETVTIVDMHLVLKPDSPLEYSADMYVTFSNQETFAYPLIVSFNAEPHERQYVRIQFQSLDDVRNDFKGRNVTTLLSTILTYARQMLYVMVNNPEASSTVKAKIEEDKRNGRP